MILFSHQRKIVFTSSPTKNDLNSGQDDFNGLHNLQLASAKVSTKEFQLKHKFTHVQQQLL